MKTMTFYFPKTSYNLPPMTEAFMRLNEKQHQEPIIDFEQTPGGGKSAALEQLRIQTLREWNRQHYGCQAAHWFMPLHSSKDIQN